MTLRSLLLVLLMVPCLALPTASSAQQGAPRGAVPMSGLDPAAFAAVENALTADVLKTLGYPSRDEAVQNALVSVTPADCSAPCSGEVDLGMCFCAPESNGTCPAGSEATGQSSGLLCKSLPANAMIFASDGGLGTTRVTIALSPRN